MLNRFFPTRPEGRSGTVGKTLFTLSIGFAGALLANSAGLPAASLLGACLAVALASLTRKIVPVPTALRDIAFTLVGSSLGCSITRETIGRATSWPVSILFLTVCVITIMLVCSWVLKRFYDQDVETSILATSPGALGYLLSIAAEGIGDIRSIVTIQSIRILLVVALLPVILDQVGSHENILIPHSVHMGNLQFLLVASISFAGGLLLQLIRTPAAFFLSGMLISGFLHYLGLVAGRPSDTLLFIGFTITGSVIGSRFSSIPMSDLRRLLAASLTVCLLSGSLAAFFSFITAKVLSIPFSQVFVAFAPGGVEAMAAMAFSLNYDPAFVAVHHLFRILFIILLTTVALKIVQKKNKNSTTP